MIIMRIPEQIKANNALLYVSSKMKQYFTYYNIKHNTNIPHNLIGQVVVER